MTRSSARSEFPVFAIDRISFLQLAKSGQGRVFVTDNILATLMTCTRSVYSFDITVTKVGDKIFFDKRDDSSFGTGIRLEMYILTVHQQQ